MLENIMKQRPKSLYAVYVEPRQIEVLHAQRRWNSWEIQSAERIRVSRSESVFDSLKRLDLKPAVKNASTLLLFLPSTYYSTHLEHYPPSMKDHLEEAVTFDWQENIFYEEERTLHFFGPTVMINDRISVPIFAILKDTYEKFYQVLNGSLFNTFAVAPSVLPSETFLPYLVSGEDEGPLELVARVLDETHIEIHRFYRGVFLDSVIIRKTFQSLKSFLANLRCLRAEVGDSCYIPHIHLICTETECSRQPDYAQEWMDAGLPIILHKLSGCLVTEWVRHLCEQDTVHTFDTEILLKPWKVPRVLWPMVAAVLLFVSFTLYQIYSTNHLAESSNRLAKQLVELDEQWKPVEQLQEQVARFKEDHKTLSTFNSEGYPLLEFMTLLTMVTPQDTWLNYFSLHKGDVVLRGESVSAINFMTDLSKTEGLTNVKFVAPVTRNPITDHERFNIQLRLNMEKLCKSIETLPGEKLETCNLPKFAPDFSGNGNSPGPSGQAPSESSDEQSVSEATAEASQEGEL